MIGGTLRRDSLTADIEERHAKAANLPTAGCWRLELAWGPHRANIDVRVVRSTL